MIDSAYDAYRAVLSENAARKPAEWTFKSNPVYRAILEHVSPEQGEAYLAVIRSTWGERYMPLIASAALENDSLGHPIVESSGLGIYCSPTNLRYAWQALSILQHVVDLDLWGVHIIEIGGGYGGLALFINRFVASHFDGRLATYTILDVPEACVIQSSFASALDFSLWSIDSKNVDYVDHTWDSGRFLVSAYAFSEFSESIRKNYEQTIVPLCTHGFLVWNMIPVYAFTERPLTIVDERPSTGVGNKVVFF